MKRKIIYILPLVIAILTIGAGCKKSTFDINKNPNLPTDSTINFRTVLPAALLNSANIVSNQWTWLQNWMGYWARSGSFAPNATEESYNVTSSFQTGVWSNLYDNAFDYQSIIAGARKVNAGYYEGVARIMRAHNFQILVDVYNNVPYFNALKGNANPTPTYDNGLAIYQDLFRQIDTAQKLLKTTSLTSGANADRVTNDIVFKGDPVKWRKFGNTLKLRLMVHMSALTTFNFARERDSILADGAGFITTIANGESAEVNPGFTADKPNNFHNAFIRNVQGNLTGLNNQNRANAYAVDYYTFNGDPRRNTFYTPVGSAYVGVPYGAPPVAANSTGNLSGIGTALGRTNIFSQWLLTSTESLFLQCEARFRGYIPGSAAATYQQAVTESFITNLLPTATSQAAAIATGTTQASNYLAGNASYPDVDFSVPSTLPGFTGGGLYAIISQKWFALNGFAPFEVWTDYRRTKMRYGVDPAVGFRLGPPISISPSNNSSVIPRRLIYPQSEYNFNAANVGGQGVINQFTSKIFWDL